MYASGRGTSTLAARRLALAALACIGCAGEAGGGPFGPPTDMGHAGADLRGGDVEYLFQPTVLEQTGTPRALALGDVDQEPDRLPDLVIADGETDQVRVLRNRQRGQFPQPDRSSHPVDRGPAAVAIGDVVGADGKADPDGKPDLVVSCAGAGTVRVLPGQGGGALPGDRGQAVMAGAAPGALVLGPLNEDARLDMALIGGEGDAVSVLLNGAMGFGPPLPYPAGRLLYALVPLSAGGRPADLAVASAGTDSVIVLANGGDGRQWQATAVPVGQVPVAVHAADLDGNGQLDVAVANHRSDSVSVLLHLSGSRTTREYPVGRRPVALGAGDVDGDGRADLVVANQESSDLTLLRNVGGGAFAAGRVRTGVGRRPVALVVGDVDGDGRAEIVVASQQPGQLTLLRIAR